MESLPSYQSCNDDDDVTLEDSPLMTSSLTSRRRHKPTWNRSAFVWMVVLSVTLVALYPLIPSRDEMELASEYNLSFWTGARQIRSAQATANQARLAMMLFDGSSPDFTKVIKKISKDNGAEGYVEPPKGCEATVLIVRHCEKGSIREHCAYIGYERSVYLASLFGDGNERWPVPSYIFAEGPGSRRNKRKMNFREIETVGPLSEKVGVDVDDSYSTKSVNKLSREILTFLQTGQLCGKLTVIAWKHSNIGHLAHHMGCGPAQGCPVDYRGNSFDNAWQIKFTYRRPDHSSRKDLELSSKPQWDVYGSVQAEGFDPLSFSKHVGDYPAGGTDHGARWKKSEVGYPERTRPSDSSIWQETRVGFDNP